MEHGFNLATHKIEKMYDYQVLTVIFDYDEDFLNQELNRGLYNLEEMIKSVVDKIHGNTHIILQLQNNDELTVDDYLSLFSTFGVVLSKRGVKNKQGYLTATESLRKEMGGTNYSKVELLNHDFPGMGTIQLTVEDEKGYSAKWINRIK